MDRNKSFSNPIFEVRDSENQSYCDLYIGFPRPKGQVGILLSECLPQTLFLLVESFDKILLGKTFAFKFHIKRNFNDNLIHKLGVYAFRPSGTHQSGANKKPETPLNSPGFEEHLKFNLPCTHL